MTVTQILAAARARGWRIATAESCTGGMVAAALTDIAGSSDVFERGFITYSNLAKRQMIGVRTASLTDFGAVSEEVAREMAAAGYRVYASVNQVRIGKEIIDDEIDGVLPHLRRHQPVSP